MYHGLAKVGDVLGSALAPRIAAAIPGTTMHHNQLIGQQEGMLNQDVKREQEQAQTANFNAESEARLHPPEKQPTNEAELWAKQNPDKPIEDFIRFKNENAAENKPEAKDKPENAQLQAENAWLQKPENKGKDLSDAARINNWRRSTIY